MLTVHRLPNLLALDRPERLSVAWRPGLTAADLVAEHRMPEWGQHPIGAAVLGRKLTEEELALPLPDGIEVVLAPEVGFELIATALVMLLVSTAVSYVFQLLVGAPKPPGLPAERGFAGSPTYSFDRIHTEYRPGLPVPMVFGTHDVGGQVIYSNVFASTGGVNTGPSEELRVVLLLSEGRCEAIGDVAGPVTGGTLGEADGLGGFPGEVSGGSIPSDIRVDGNRLDHVNPLPGARVWLRMGEITQTPLPAVPFTGVSSTLVVNQPLDEAQQEQQASIAESKQVSVLSFILQFPAGLYQQDTQGNLAAYPVSFEFFWRPTGVGAFQRLGVGSYLVSVQPVLSSFSVTVGFALVVGGQPAQTPIEMQVRRLTASGGTNVVSRCQWRQLNYSLATYQFSYPRCTLLGLNVLATEATTGGRGEFLVRLRGMRVRVWDATIGGGLPSTARYFAVPASGDPYFGIWTYGPGRNPAWILAELLTHPAGLGEWVSDDDVDWPSLRSWADFCDQDATVGATSEAYMRCDLVVDSPDAAWDHVMRICQCGRAVPVVRGNKIGVKYEFSGAHGRGTNSVPAKAATQVFSTTNVRDFSVTYLNVRERPGVISAQFLNAAKDYAQDVVDVVDPEGGFDRPDTLNPLGYTKAAVQMYGMVRYTQVTREALFMHAVNAFVRSMCEFEVGPEALAAEVGDVIAVQHDILRPFSVESFSYRVHTTSNVASIKLDRPFTAEVGKTYEVVARQADGTVATRAVTAGAGVYAAGSAIALASSVNVLRGAPAAVGETAKVVKEYQIVQVSLAPELRRRVRAIEWVPAMHALTALSVASATEGTTEVYYSTATPLVEDASGAAAKASALRVSCPVEPGELVLGWEQPDGFRSRKARIYLRPSGSARWWAIDEVKGTEARLRLPPGEQYQVAVALKKRDGRWQMPDEGTSLTFTAPEFPQVSPPSVRRGAIAASAGVLRLRWDPVDSPWLDYYEVRHGSRWTGARVVGRTRNPWLEVPLAPRFDGTVGAGSFSVRARSKRGLYSPRELLLDGASTNPYSDSASILDSAPNPASEGTLIDAAYTDSKLQIAAGKLQGRWDSQEFIIGYDVAAMVLLYWEQWGEDLGFLVDHATFEVDSGEARWRTVDGRDASLVQPGIQTTELVDDFTMTCDDLDPARRVATWLGEPGENHSARVYVRTAAQAGSIGSAPWEEYRPQWRQLGRAQVRIDLARADASSLIAVSSIRIRVMS